MMQLKRNKGKPQYLSNWFGAGRVILNTVAKVGLCIVFQKDV